MSFGLLRQSGTAKDRGSVTLPTRSNSAWRWKNPVKHGRAQNRSRMVMTCYDCLAWRSDKKNASTDNSPAFRPEILEDCLALLQKELLSEEPQNPAEQELYPTVQCLPNQQSVCQKSQECHGMQKKHHHWEMMRLRVPSAGWHHSKPASKTVVSWHEATKLVQQ